MLSLFMLILLPACQTVSTSTPTAPTSIPAATRTLAPLVTATATLPVHLQVEPKDLRGLQIRFLHPWAGDTANAIDLLVETFNRSNEWGIRVKAESAGGTGMLFQEIIGMDAGDLPNLIAAPAEYLFTWNQTHPEMLVNLDEYIQHSAWGLTQDQIEDLIPEFWQQDVAGAYRLGIPLLRDASVLLYNQSWAQELGFTRPPKTPDDFRQQACAAAAANRSDRTIANDGTGGWIVETRGVTLWSWLRSFGSDPILAGTDAYRFAAPESEAAFAFLRGLVDENCAWKSRLAAPYEYFANRQALFYSGVLEDTLIQTHTMERLKISDQWTVIPYPSLDGQPVMVASGPSLAVTGTSPEEQLASWLFVRWLLAPEHLAELTKAAGGLPVTQSAVAELQRFGTENPQWQAGVSYLDQVQTPPANATWRTVRSLLEDAGYQALLPSIKPEQIPGVLKMLDEMIVEVGTTPD
ncbi:MAG TPA: extracellular solute-binding protein [Longilinea sp.]|nr:extracellular solute-binding protein [Longilinea sp.]